MQINQSKWKFPQLIYYLIMQIFTDAMLNPSLKIIDVKYIDPKNKKRVFDKKK